MALKPIKADKSSDASDKKRLSNLMNSLADAVIAVDRHARVQSYNAAALEVLDINTIKQAAPFDSICALIDKNDKPFDVLRLIFDSSTPHVNRDLRIRYDDGNSINVYISVAPLKLGYGSGEETGYVLLLRDITKEKSLEEKRDEFISVVSHELRTPIAIAEGNISNAEVMIGRSGDPRAVKHALKEAHEQILFLADIINDLSTLGRVERGDLPVEIEAINLYDLAHELADDYRPQAKGKGLDFKLELDPALELLSSSKLYVREILQNLIINALKYTYKGSVTLKISPGPKGALFELQDTGIGIGAGDQKRIFDKFFRSEDHRTRQSSGTGLGLYVTRKLAHLIRAEISLASELNHGSTFSVLVPDLKG